jgi:hypothetical protein
MGSSASPARYRHRYGTGSFSEWLIVAVIVPPSPVWEEDQWRNRAPLRRVIVSDLKRNLSTCPALAQTTVRVRDGPAFV